MKDTLGVLLAGGAGERLYPLTRDRAKPAVPFGGIYRIIDITLSNCINSDLRHVYILTQYKALSLNRHIREGWGTLWAANWASSSRSCRPCSASARTGTWEPPTRSTRTSTPSAPSSRKYVLILSGDHIYKMNYGLMLRQHKDSGADVTLATLLIDPAETPRFGVVEIDRERPGHRLPGEAEDKPTCVRLTIPHMVYASMGIYLFNTDVLIPVLLKDAEDPTPATISATTSCPQCCDDYKRLRFQFRRREQKGSPLLARRGNAGRLLRSQYGPGFGVSGLQPLRSTMAHPHPSRQYPPAKFVFAEPRAHRQAIDSLVSAGCIISGGIVRNCVLSPNVRVNSYSEVDTSILFSHVNMGRHCRIRHAIIDRDVHIPEGTVIGYDPEADREHYFVTDSGITVVTRDYSLFENPVTVDYFTSE